MHTGTHFMFFSQLWINKSYMSYSTYIWYLYFCLCVASPNQRYSVCSSPHFHLVVLWLLCGCTDWRTVAIEKSHNSIHWHQIQKFSGKRKAFHDICSGVRDVVIILLSMCWSERALDYFALGSMSMTLVGVCLRWETVAGLRKQFYLHIFWMCFFISVLSVGMSIDHAGIMICDEVNQ